MKKLTQFHVCETVVWHEKVYHSFANYKKIGAVLYIDKPIFRIQSDTVYALGIAAVSRHLRSILKRAHRWAIFFRRGINLNAQRKSARIPRVLVGPPLELIRSTSSADCCCIFDDLVQTKRKGKPDCADRKQAARLLPSPRGTLCKERNVEIDILTDRLRKKGERGGTVASLRIGHRRRHNPQRRRRRDDA